MKGLLLKAQAKKMKLKQRQKEREKEEENDQANMMDSDDEGEVSKGMVGMLFKYRYFVLKYLGSGGFARIWLVYDIIENRYAAMKVQYPGDYAEATKEHAVMMALGANRYCMSLLDTFDQVFEGEKYFCFVLELLGPDLYKLTEKRRPIPLYAIKQITYEILKGLEYIHSRGYFHTDLKPENILLVNYSPKIQKVIDWFESLKPNHLYSMIKTSLTPENLDTLNKEKRKKVKSKIRMDATKKFQNAMFGPVIEEISKYWDLSDDDESDSDSGSDSDSDESGSDSDDSNSDSENDKDNANTEYIQAISKDGQYVKIGDFGLAERIADNPEDIQTTQFRAPEVILVFDRITEKADIWSVGCIVFELFMCRTLFRIEEHDEKMQDFEHLFKMQKLLGKFPVDFIDQGNVSDDFFTEDKKAKFKNKKYRELMATTPAKSLREMFVERKLSQFRNSNNAEFETMLDFVLQCFRYSPKLRPSASELLKHDWFNAVKMLQSRQEV